MSEEIKIRIHLVRMLKGNILEQKSVKVEGENK